MKLEKTEAIWFNGRFVPWDEAKVHVLTHALHYATAVFEGIRAYETKGGTAVLGLRPHVERLLTSCRILELPLRWSREALEAAILETVRVNRHRSCYIRPLVFRGLGVLGVDPSQCPVDVVIATWTHGPHWGEDARAQGIDVGVSSWRRIAPDTLPAMAKAVGNYLNSALIKLEANRHGYADAIALDHQGFVSEGSGMNVFAAHGGALRTPPIGSSILSGITRAFAIRLAKDLAIPVVEEQLPRELLYAADEVFLTGTAAEITPVRSVDRRTVGAGLRGPITEQLQREFLGIVSGDLPDRHEWLTLVGP